MLNPRQNLEEVLGWGKPEYVPTVLPGKMISVNDNHFTNQAGRGRWQDRWGVTWSVHRQDGYHFPVAPAARTLNEALALPFPDPASDSVCLPAVEAAASFAGKVDGFLMANHEDFLFSRMWLLLGMEECLAMLAAEPDASRALARRIMDYHLRVAQTYADLGAEIVRLCDDYGMQNALFFRPAVWREVFRPELERIIGFYRARGIRVLFHSCGHIQEIVADLVDLGISILNPVQAKANDLSLVRRLTAGKVVLFGGIDTQDLLSFGTPDRVRREVRLLLWQLGRDGGWIASADQGITGIPPENLAAMTETLARFGQYPLKAEDFA